MIEYVLETSGWRGRVERDTRNRVRKAEQGLEAGPGSLEELRMLHWNPIYLPLRLGVNQRIIAARVGGQPVAAALFTLRGEEAEYTYAAQDPDYRSMNGASRVLAYAADNLPVTRIVLGGSAKSGIESFKRSWSTSRREAKSRNRLMGKIRFRVTRWIPYRIRRTLEPGGLVQREFMYAAKHRLGPAENPRRIIHIGIDDVNHRDPTPFYDAIREMKEKVPSLRVSCFTVPHGLEDNTDALRLLDEPWVDPALHGWMHSRGEDWSLIGEERARLLLREGVKAFGELGFPAECFKPPKYRSAPYLPKLLAEAGFTDAFLDNGQWHPLRPGDASIRAEGGLRLHPTNVSCWLDDPQRVGAIIRSGGALSLQTHAIDWLKHSVNIERITKRAVSEGYVFATLTGETILAHATHL